MIRLSIWVKVDVQTDANPMDELHVEEWNEIMTTLEDKVKEVVSVDIEGLIYKAPKVSVKLNWDIWREDCGVIPLVAHPGDPVCHLDKGHSGPHDFEVAINPTSLFDMPNEVQPGESE